MLVKVKVLFFAQAKDLAGKNTDIIEVPEFITCFNLLEILVKQYSLQKIQNNILVSLNQQLYHIEDNLTLQEGDEIAIIPPLSGG